MEDIIISTLTFKDFFIAVGFFMVLLLAITIIVAWLVVRTDKLETKLQEQEQKNKGVK